MVSRLVAGAPRASTTEWSDEPVEATRAFWQGLGLPGLFDVHVHFLPPNIQRRVWEQFDTAGPKIGREWPIRYRGSRSRNAWRCCASSAYAASRRCPTRTSPGSRRTSTTGRAVRGRRAGVAVVGDVLPRAGGGGVRRRAGRRGGRGVQDPRPGRGVPARRPGAGRRLGAPGASGTPVVVHAGSGPVPNAFTGPGPLERVLGRWPRLAVVVAHLGAPEYVEFLELAERFERVYLDTTMAFTDFFEQMAPYPTALLPRLADLRRQGAAGQRLPDDPVPLPAPAGGPGTARSRGTLAARGVLGQRCATIRSERRATPR